MLTTRGWSVALRNPVTIGFIIFYEVNMSINENPKVELHVKNFGVITIELDAEKAPKTVGNFLSYANSGHYDGTIFHRVIPGFMIQGGGMAVGMKEKPSGEPIRNEADNGLKNKMYTVAMARTGDPHSATAQFFINVADNEFLNFKSPTPPNWGYAVFGKVCAGEDIVTKIAALTTTRKGFHDDVPKDDVIIEKIIVSSKSLSENS
jgi:peptidyl-prolyl cis-trans isomerase B (cyclophilin B)